MLDRGQNMATVKQNTSAKLEQDFQAPTERACHIPGYRCTSQKPEIFRMKDEKLQSKIICSDNPN